MRYLWLVPSIFLTHICLGRFFSVPYTLALFNKWYLSVCIISSIDMITVPFYFRLFDSVITSRGFVVRERLLIRRLRRVIEKLTKKKIFRRERKLHSRILVRAQRWGQFGVILVAALPFVGGGIWSGVLLARFLKLKIAKGHLLIWLGSILGASFISLGIQGIKELIVKFL
ncbi:hypothetical protein GTN66_07125 [bacterium]|nr:hypothetical protein [bacterium]NIO19035.1 hypothetical protein [bacterium]NIO74164.1 hypothetical protein [bacterium]